MQTTFSNGLGVSFFGKGVTPGMPAHVANGGTRTIGGTIDKSNTNIAKFGCALFVNPAKPSNFIVGPTVSATLFRGILMNRNMVNQQMPAHADYILNETPADAFYQGAIYVAIEGTVKVGDKVYAKADGSLTNVSSSNTAINGIVKEYDPSTNLYLVYFDGQF